MTLIIAGIIIVLVIAIWPMYNSIVRRHNEVNEAWAQIEVQMQKRFDLIPNLVNTVKGYAKHESGVLEKVTEARTAADTAGRTGDVDDVVAANGKLGIAVNAVREAYPDLKADQSFLALQETLQHTEESIAATRRMYNNAVLDYNNAIQTFPRNLVAGVFHYGPSKMFEVDDEKAAHPVKVDFDAD